MKRILAVVLILSLSLCSCKSVVQKYEITDLAIVMAVGLDADEEGIRMSLLVQSDNSGGAGRLYSQSGKTIVDCLLHLTQVCEKIPFFGHTEMVLIGPSLWDQEIGEKLDWFVRSSRLRQECIVNAVQGTTAEDFMLKCTDGSVFLTQAIQEAYRSESLYHLSPDARVSRVMQSRSDSAHADVLPCLKLHEAEDGSFVPCLNAYLIVQQGQDICVMQDQQAMGLHLLRGDSYALRFQTLDETGKTAMMETQSIRCRLSLEDTEPLAVKVQLSVSLSLLEYYGSGDPSREPTLSALTENSRSYLINCCSQTISLMRSTGCDLLGLSDLCRRTSPETFDGLQDRWPEEIRTMRCEFIVDVQPLHSNQLGTPAGS